MSTNHIDMEHHNISAAVATLGTGDMEMENAALADTPGGRLQRLVKVYGAVKPLLSVLTTLVIIPPSWRAGLAVFVQTLDAVIVVAPQLAPGLVKIDGPQPAPVFKAGKDL